MNVSEILDMADILVGQAVTVSGHMTRSTQWFQEPSYIRPTQESSLAEGAIQIDVTNLDRQLDEIAADIKTRAQDLDLAFALLGVIVWHEGPLGHPKPDEVGKVEITGKLAPPIDPGFAASLTDITSAKVIRPDHIYRIRRGIKLSDFVTTETITVADALSRRNKIDQQQVSIRGELRNGYLCLDGDSAGDRANSILLDPEIHESLWLAFGGPPISYRDAMVTGIFINEGPLAARLKEIIDVTIQKSIFCVASWGTVLTG